MSLRKYLHISCGLAVAMFASTAARANVVASYSNFCGASGLTLVGNTAITSGCALRLTTNGGGEAGAAYSTTPITLGANATFSTTFQFQITQPGGIDPADGIAFVLAANSTGLGTSGGDMGYGGVGHSIGIEFDTYNNGGTDGNSSNHVAIDENGNIINGTSMSDQNLTNVYGVSTCDFGTATSYTANGCLSNGHIWTATASYNGTNLSLSISDPAEGATDVIYSNLAVDISSLLGTNTAFVGFTAGTGAGYENQDILNWQFANDTSLASSTPEPASFVLLASALGALWVTRSVCKRRAQA